jgi:hypothetical protein
VIDCSGTPTTCLPAWTLTNGTNNLLNPIVVNGTLYVISADDTLLGYTLP